MGEVYIYFEKLQVHGTFNNLQKTTASNTT